ncbi:MAG: hypothetical protein AAF636_05335 [Pseudomonadota bacterium]
MARDALGANARDLPIPVTRIEPYLFGTSQALGTGLAAGAMRWQDPFAATHS